MLTPDRSTLAIISKGEEQRERERERERVMAQSG